jgi:hypothetical protein
VAHGKTSADYAADYTEPELRERLKEELKQGHRGGAPGQWSARKSQLLQHEYEAQGGDYRHPGTRTESQRHLSKWSDEDWQTSDGEGDARHGGATDRYLPELAWKLMTEAERRATDERKHDGTGQHVANTDAAREAELAADVVERTAPEAVELIRGMDTRSGLERARRAEADHGSARKTVLAAIDARLERLP